MERIDVVNDNNVVIGQVPKSELYDGPNNHRIVHVLIFNDQGELALQQRSRTVDFLPGYWTTVVGGHVQAGESPDQAARREMTEEIGVNIPFEILFEFVYEPPNVPGMKKFLTVYQAHYNGPFSPNLEKVERVEYFDLEKIKSMVDRNEKTHHELSIIISKIYGAHPRKN